MDRTKHRLLSRKAVTKKSVLSLTVGNQQLNSIAEIQCFRLLTLFLNSLYCISHHFTMIFHFFTGYWQRTYPLFINKRIKDGIVFVCIVYDAFISKWVRAYEVNINYEACSKLNLNCEFMSTNTMCRVFVIHSDFHTGIRYSPSEFQF